MGSEMCIRDRFGVVGLTLGTGVGGGVVINRKVYHGSWNTAGELGHTVVQPNGRKCGCGNHGCLEAYAGARHIVERAQQQIASGRKTCLNPERLTPKQIAEAATAGDELAFDIFSETGRYIGIALTSIAHILNPCLLYTSPSPRDRTRSRMPSSA